MKIKFLYITLVLGLMLGLMSCQDDRLYDDSVIPDGDSRISATVSFESFTPALESRTTGTAINSIDRLWVVLFDGNGNFVNKYQILDYKSENVNTDKPTDWPSQENPDWETSTPNPRATFNLTVPMGKYKIYAVANLDLSDKELATEADLKGIQLDWDENDINNNKEMFGYFDTEVQKDGAYGFDAPLVTLARENINLHAWIKRAASKVTVAFDGKGLKEQVQIYIKSVAIKDIPKQCYLGKPNEVGLGYDFNGADRAKLLFPTGEVSKIEGNLDGNSSAYFKPETHYHVCQDQHRYGGFGDQGKDQAILDNAHAPEANSFFFYENMQGTGKDKAQTAAGPGNDQKPGTGIGFPDPVEGDLTSGWKDHKPYGTYVEVEGYYVSRNPQNPGDGPIKFRFMLGKDIATDYNAERNHHYKLTLMFKGYGNDADWHIEYEEPKGIVVPDPYYISYLYDQTMTLPIKVVGKEVNKINVEIVENNWAPEAPNNDELFYYQAKNSGVWNGFLSLREAKTAVIQAPSNDEKTLYGEYDSETKTFKNSYNEQYYNEHYRGKRNYRIDGAYENVDGKDNDSEANGAYSVTETNKGYTFNIPLYTRAKQMVPATGYTGNNPYVAYQRTAKIRITAFDKDGVVIGEPRDVTIIQVRRIVNPKGVWRRWDNDEPFHVVLKRLPEENATGFEVFNSDGPWSAEVEIGADWINLDGNKTKVTGGSETPIDFTINPNGNTGGKDKVRYGIVKVRYHNYTCVHRIFVRQGYAPQPVRTNGTIKWHVFNARTRSAETTDPREEGNMFRNHTQGWANPIDASNNTPNMFNQGRKDTPFYIDGYEAQGGRYRTWDNIPNGLSTDNFKDPPVPYMFNPDYADKPKPVCRIATQDDYEIIHNYNNSIPEVEYGYGVLYADGATETADNTVTAYEYRRDREYENDPQNRKHRYATYGMRGCFVYNKNTGANIFFPIGASGYGRIKHGGPTVSDPSHSYMIEGANKYAVLKYASRADYYGKDPSDRDVAKLPLFYDIFKRPGAVYWTGYGKAWDINYFTFDFGTFGGNAYNYGKSDAAFIRSVE